jgi:hypothetical protein
MILVFFSSFVSKQEVRHGYRGDGGRVFFANLYLRFILYFHPKNPRYNIPI